MKPFAITYTGGQLVLYHGPGKAITIRVEDLAIISLAVARPGELSTDEEQWIALIESGECRNCQRCGRPLHPGGCK